MPWFLLGSGQAAIALSGAANGINAMACGSLVLHLLSPAPAQINLFTHGFANLFMSPLISKSMLNVQSLALKVLFSSDFRITTILFDTTSLSAKQQM